MKYERSVRAELCRMSSIGAFGIVLLVLVGCTSLGDPRKDAPPNGVANLSANAAQTQMARLAETCFLSLLAGPANQPYWYKYARIWAVPWRGIWATDKTWQSTTTPTASYLAMPKSRFFTYRQSSYFESYKNMVQVGDDEWFICATNADAKQFSGALNRLSYAAWHGELDVARAADFARFRAATRVWRDKALKPRLGQDVERQRILAENAIAEKNVDSAVDHFEAGVKANPMWAQGWYNAALIWGELENYARASWDMKHYLTLMPNAPDASAARKEMIIWEDKAKDRQEQ